MPPVSERWVHFPVSPDRFPFFYGWVIVGISTLSIIASIPGQTAGVGVFTDHLLEALSMDRERLSLAYMVGTLLSGLVLPAAGRLLDRIGVRLMSGIASLGLLFSLLLMASVDSLAALLASGLPVEWAGMLAVSLAFFLIRFFGQGNMTTVGRVAMGRWFNRHRGLATAISGVPATLSFNAAPWLLTALIAAVGWREACVWMALVAGGGMTVLGLLLFRDTPEDCGLTMDGISPSDGETGATAELHPIQIEFTRSGALKTLSFWSVTGLLSLHAMIITAVSFHILDFGQEMGRPPSEATRWFLYAAIFTIPSRFAAAWVFDRTRQPLSRILMLKSLLMAGGLLGLATFDTLPGFWTTAVMFGLAGGIWGILADAALPRFFGRRHLGEISAAAMSAMVLSSAIGPFLFSYGKTFLGSYRMVLLWLLVLPVLLLLMAHRTRNPQHIAMDA